MAKNPAAVALGRLGGLKGGKARAAALSPEIRSAIARKAGLAAAAKRAGGMSAVAMEALLRQYRGTGRPS